MVIRDEFLKRRKFWKHNLAEAATISYSATDNFLQCIYSVLVAKNHQKFLSTYLVHECSFTNIFNNINDGYKAAILKKNPLWPLSFFMAVAVAHCNCIAPP